MKIIKKKTDLETFISELKKENKTIGFVPTMGALHQGHISLVKRSKDENKVTVVSIFINPTQFDRDEDLTKYPKTLDKDIELLEAVNCNALFTPSAREIYGQDVVCQTFDFEGLDRQMEGKFRKGHFDGVATIVKKLFNLVKPNLAYFGEKDFQQLQIISKMVQKENLSVKVIGCPIFRQSDGLAMSSRNSLLSVSQRKEATFIFEILQKIKNKIRSKNPKQITKWVSQQFENHPLLKLEYFSISDQKTLKETQQLEEDKKYRAFIAVYAGDVRLIDNIAIEL